jgi:very-long-chain ceramide synthase
MLMVSCDRCHLFPQLAKCLQAIKVLTHVCACAEKSAATPFSLLNDCGTQNMSTSALKRRKPAAPGSPAVPSKKKSNRKLEKLSPIMIYLRANYSIIAFALLSTLFVAAKSGLFPGATGYVEMKHQWPATGEYVTGPQDLKFVVGLVLFLLIARWGVCSLIFKPLAQYAVPGMKPELEFKYTDMGWQLVWYTGSWVASVYFLYERTGFDLEKCWQFQNYPDNSNPHLRLSYGFKLFYLTELAFWLHMILITLIEERRKDFPVMMAHHFLTSGLIFSSYYLNMASIGTAVLAEQDFADIFLPLAKLFKYSKCNNLADIVFAFFAVAWIPTRHGLFFYILRSIYNSPQYVTDVNPYNPAIGGYLSQTTINVFMVVLSLFQCLLLIWLKDIVVAVHKALTSTGNVEDQRSDSD